MFSVKTLQATPLKLTASSIAIKQQWLTLGHWACPLNNSPKDSGGVKKTRGWKKHNEIIIKLYVPFYGWDIKSQFEEAVVLYDIKFPEIPGTHSIDFGSMKVWVNLGATQCFENGTPGLGFQQLNY